MEKNISEQSSENQEFNIRELLEFIWRIRWWMVASAFVMLILGFVYTRMQTPIYQRQAWIMLNNNDGTNAEMALFAEMMGAGNARGRKIDNEIFILKSPSLMAKVVDELDLNTRYFQYRLPVLDRSAYGRGFLAWKLYEFYQDNPYTMTFAVDSLYPEEMRPAAFTVKFKHKADGTFRLKKLTLNGFKQDLPGKKDYHYGEPIVLEGLTITISVNDLAKEEMKENSTYLCTWTNSKMAAKALSRRPTGGLMERRIRPHE